MKLAKKILLFYGAVLTIIIVVGTLIIDNRIENLILLVFFLPVPLYFVYTLIDQLRNPNPKKLPLMKKQRLRIVGIIFVILVGIAILNISKQSNTVSKEIPIGKSAHQPDSKSAQLTNNPSRRVAESPTDIATESSKLRFGKPKNKEASPSASTKKISTKIVIETDEEIDYVNIRKAASSSAEKIGTAEIGETFTSISKDGEWYEVELEDDKTGWIHGDFVSNVE